MAAHPPLLFLDTETLGLRDDSPIWEVAAILIEPDGYRHQCEWLVFHDPALMDPDLPEDFRADYAERYNPEDAIWPQDVITYLNNLTADKPLVLGSNPGFDMARLEKTADDCGLPRPTWHYSPENVPTLARGWLAGKGVFPAPPWSSDFISRACGVDPKAFDRHTALGDCLWSLELWNRVMGG